MEVWVPALAVFLVSAMLQGASGFGMALLAVPLLTLLVDPKVAVPAVTMAGMAVSALTVIQLWRHCDWRRAAWLGIPALLAAPFGVHLLKVLTSQQLCFGLGVVLILSSVVSLCQKQRSCEGAAAAGRAARIGPVGSVAVGGFSGVLGGALGMTGPLLADYLNKSGIRPDEFRITLNLIFLASSVWRTGLYAAQHVMTGPTLWLAAGAIPVAALGAFVGGVAGRRIRPETFTNSVNWMLLLIGIGMLVQSWR